jgi:hypothetical protein
VSGRDVSADVDADDVRALGREPECVASTLSARNTSDERDALLE